MYCVLHTVLEGNRASLVAQIVKNLPAMQKTRVWSLGQEDPLEEGMATHTSIFAWRIPWTEEAGGPQPVGSQRVGNNWVADSRGNALMIKAWILPSR